MHVFMLYHINLSHLVTRTRHQLYNSQLNMNKILIVVVAMLKYLIVNQIKRICMVRVHMSLCLVLIFVDQELRRYYTDNAKDLSRIKKINYICSVLCVQVHVIFSYKGKNHLINKDIRCKDDVFTHFYTLIVKPDNTYEVLIDNEKVESGTFEEDWDFLPPKKIKDPEAKKPEDWDERVSLKTFVLIYFYIY